MDKTYPIVDGFQRILLDDLEFDPAITTYSAAVPAFDSMLELLANIRDVLLIDNLGLPGPGHSTYK